MGAFNPQLQLYSATFNDKAFTAENNLAQAYLTESQWLSGVTTFLYGGGSEDYSSYNFPMLYVTQGLGRNAKKALINTADLSYKWPVLGRPKRISSVSRSIYSATDKPGYGFQPFVMYFSDSWFQMGQEVYTPSGLVARVQRKPERMGKEYKFTLALVTHTGSTYLQPKDVKQGAKWGEGPRKVSKSRSRGGESRSYTPYTLNNQLGVVRDTYNVVGNMGNKVMVYEIAADGRRFKLWAQWELYQSDLAFRSKLEHDLWFSKYNKDADGVIHNIDEDSDEVVPSGAGLEQQIDNVDTYVNMTAKKIETIINDLVYNASEAQNVTIDVYTGTGGLNEVSRALEDRQKSNGLTYVDTTGISQRGEQGGKRQYYGYYFDRYQTREGHTVRFRYHPMFDRGTKAEMSEMHPVDGRPIFSYNMFAVDMSTYEGEPNVQYVAESGRESITKTVQGLAEIPFGDNSGYAASDIDASSVEQMKTQGIVIKRPTNCLKVYNTILG